MERYHSGSVGSQRGFTLIELMIVIVIIGILATVSIPNYINYQKNAKVARTASELRSLSQAFVAYVAENGEFPPDSHATLPAGMELYINPAIWAEETPIGGNYNWEGLDTYPYAGLAILDPTIEVKYVIALDAMLDNGDLATGRFRNGTNGRPTLIIAE